MENNRNILVLLGDSSPYENPFNEWGRITHDVDELENCVLVVFTGGTDVDPELYGEVRLPTTNTPDTNRDIIEQGVYTRALILELPMIGICRGAQFLNVMNNGKLLQHIDGHSNCEHPVTTINGDVFDVRGDHHQAMRPEGNHTLLAVSNDGLPEVVIWPHSRCLGVQYHPEWMSDDTDGYLYFQTLLEDIM